MCLQRLSVVWQAFRVSVFDGPFVQGIPVRWMWVSVLSVTACVSQSTYFCLAGQGRSVLNDGALYLYQLGNVEYTVTAGAGETSEYASKAAALDLAAVLEEPTLWDGVEGGPNCTVTCNGGVCSMS